MASEEFTLQRFPVPGLPCLLDRAESFKATGPDTAEAFLLLWENLMQRAIPGRAERSLMRIEHRAADKNQPEHPLTYSVLRRLVRDDLWRNLCLETARQLTPEVHVFLWAPFVDPATGQLPEKDLDQHIKALFPRSLTEADLGHEHTKFLDGVSGTVWNSQHTRPHVRTTCEKPVYEKRDQDEQIHCHDGPALVWADGSSSYFWRGLRAPPKWFGLPTSEWMADNPGCPVPAPRGCNHEPPVARDALYEENLELRRVAMEIVGYDSVVEQLGGRVIDEDPDPQIGTLLEVDMPVNTRFSRQTTERQRFLRVTCGTGRRFSLAVPPTIRTAKAANAWTYGLEPDEYAPEVRT